MTWLFALLVVAVVGVTAVVAAGRGGELAEAEDDRPPRRLPDGPLTGEDLRGVRFSTALRGYRMAEVDALLDRLAHDLDVRPGESPPGDGR